MVTVTYSLVVHEYFDFVWTFYFGIFPSNHMIVLFSNLMKGNAALVLCIAYFAPPIQCH